MRPGVRAIRWTGPPRPRTDRAGGASPDRCAQDQAVAPGVADAAAWVLPLGDEAGAAAPTP